MGSADRVVVSWDTEYLEDRLERCRRMLYLHGMLTESENERLRFRGLKRRAAIARQAREDPARG